MKLITFYCPSCQQKIEAPAELAGQNLPCPTCGQSFTVPKVERFGMRSFDLNIEEVLENWDVEHALREIIANALDEQVLSNTPEIAIAKDEQGDWRIRDYGRGLQIKHFTLNENKEKLDARLNVIGKFGVGLKDALATFNRAGVRVLIHSKFGTYRLKQEHKSGFDNIITLHIEYTDTPNDIVGSEFILSGITDADMTKAKSLFCKFAGEQIYESNTYGQILCRNGDTSRVYILGVLASEESNFLFSYNITSLTDTMRKTLNRERLNVGRATYAERVKTILKNAKSKVVEALLVEEVMKRGTGDQSDEMAWIEISQMAFNLMHQQKKVAYFTEEELQSRPNVLDSVRSDGYEVVVITDQQKAKLETQIQSGGLQVRTLETYVQEYNASFEYKFVEPTQLTKEERSIYDCSSKILSLIGLSNCQLPKIRISETMRVMTDDTEGVWDSSIQTIVIKRTKLSTLAGFAATLLHETAHATTGNVDATREFESVLTNYLGMIAVIATKQEMEYSWLHQERAKVIADIYAKIVSAKTLIERLGIQQKVFQHSPIGTKGKELLAKEMKERRTKMSVAIDEVKNVVDTQQIYFSGDALKHLLSVSHTLNSFDTVYGITTDTLTDCPTDETTMKMANELVTELQNAFVTSLESLKAEFQVLTAMDTKRATLIEKR